MTNENSKNFANIENNITNLQGNLDAEALLLDVSFYSELNRNEPYKVNISVTREKKIIIRTTNTITKEEKTYYYTITHKDPPFISSEATKETLLYTPTRSALVCMYIIKHYEQLLDDFVFLFLYKNLIITETVISLTKNTPNTDNYFRTHQNDFTQLLNVIKDYAAKAADAEERVLNNKPKVLKQLNEPATNETPEETFNKRKHKYLIVVNNTYHGEQWSFTKNYQTAFAIYLIDKFKTTAKAIDWINRFEGAFNNKESLKKTVEMVKRKTPHKNNRQRQNFDEAVKEFNEFFDYVEQNY